MAKLSFQGQCINTLAGEKVLDAYLRSGITVPFSCRDGVCHSCTQIAVAGNVPAAAQKGLSASQREQGYFLPCICVPTDDMTIQSLQESRPYIATMVQEKELLAQGVCKLSLEPTLTQTCQLGQFIQLRSVDGQERRFAIVNQPADEYYLTIHVPRAAGDAFGDWVFDQLASGSELEIQGPYDEDLAAASVNNTPASEQSAGSQADMAQGERPKDPPTDPELWEALQHGKLLMEILQDFYGRVYQDELLSPYFHGTTMRRSIEKVYSFMNQIITGEKSFFGDRPKNAHHWMVISDETFKYREALMMECQRRAGLSEEMIQRWMAIENYYKQDIIKSTPWKRTMGNVELPLEGFGEIVLDEGSVCDGCNNPVEAGEKIKYHLRLGTIYCNQCNTVEA